ncbi:MAG: threonine--tRNA ligase [Burkholderiales bacterium]|jgi:threonyl-tRNA synthetase|nr:threonine--tRNA ligase [Burkholderiales bacterium]
MIQVKLPDNSIKNFEQALTILDVAKSISPSLAKATLAGRINEELKDVSYLIDHDCSLKLVTEKDNEALDIIRHSAAHLLAQAVKQLFPGAQVTIGPVIENGFFYDFSYERAFTPEDVVLIEKRMHDIVKSNQIIERKELSREDAIAYFASIGEKYKVEIISAIANDQILSLYTQGDFTDLCRGPHVPSTSKIKAFKLTKLAGAYWRGDSKNEMLQRIYGTAWRNKEELDNYLTIQEEAKRRDHRIIGKNLDLFHQQDEAPGMIFWHPKGWAIWQEVEQLIRREISLDGYQELKTPQIVDRSLWEKSGHWSMFGESMFTTHSENRDYAIKPMNCPCHILVFNQGLKSYRDLPIRFAEFGSCHRNEPSGSLHGIMRVRNFIQDDGHIFCTEDQLQNEAQKFIDLVFRIYKIFGFNDVAIKLSTRPEKRVGDDSFWDSSETALANALESKNLKYTLQPGEGAFYGPKIEFALKDCLGREWQCGTLQLDPNMPGRLGATYIAEDGSKKVPLMLHRAVLGSLERFIGVLIEHYAGDFPLWLAPIQAAVLNISEKQAPYAVSVYNNLKNNGFRCELDISNEKIGYKIREKTLLKVPYLIIIGDKEIENNTITLRKRDGTDMGSMTLEQFQELLGSELIS